MCVYVSSSLSFGAAQGMFSISFPTQPPCPGLTSTLGKGEMGEGNMIPKLVLPLVCHRWRILFHWAALLTHFLFFPFSCLAFWLNQVQIFSYSESTELSVCGKAAKTSMCITRPLMTTFLCCVPPRYADCTLQSHGAWESSTVNPSCKICMGHLPAVAAVHYV